MSQDGGGIAGWTLAGEFQSPLQSLASHATVMCHAVVGALFQSGIVRDICFVLLDLYIIKALILSITLNLEMEYFT